MNKTISIEVWVLVDEDGDYAVAKDGDSLSDAYENDVQSIGYARATRNIKVTLSVPLPQVLELSGTVPDESNEGTLTVVG